MIPLKDRIPSRHLPWVTYLLIIANCYIFYRQLQLDPTIVGQFISRYGIIPAHVLHWSPNGFSADLTPLFTSMFLHAGWWHIIGNMWALWLFGDNVEDRLGSLRYLLLYLASGIAAGIVQIYAFPASTVPVIGASGAIAGVMAAYLFLYPFSKILTLIPVVIIPLFIDIPAFIYIGIWFALQVLHGTSSLHSSYASSGIAWWAHIGGFAAGLICLALFWPTCRKRRPELPNYYRWYRR